MRSFRSYLLLLLLATGCATHRPDDAGRTLIRITGSDSMLLLVQRWSERYMQAHPGVTVQTAGGGSGAGIAALTDGTTDLCAASRPLTADEVSALARKHQTLGVGTLCARDALQIIIHPANSVRSLTQQQIADIFTGALDDWSQVGGGHGPIHRYIRESTSGTYRYFEDHVLLGAGYSAAAVTIAGARAMIDAVAQDSNAIGYSTSAYADRVASVRVNGVAPSESAVRDGSYPVARYFFLYSLHQPTGELKRFLDWVTGPDGQRIASENGYIPLYSLPR